MTPRQGSPADAPNCSYSSNSALKIHRISHQLRPGKFFSLLLQTRFPHKSQSCRMLPVIKPMTEGRSSEAI
ncbi:hypothetical protein LDENG_00162790 [Lucifuga dentata]|nr:hypothetical protein LDENG_00162790 [Lucifuga dentata]